MKTISIIFYNLKRNVRHKTVLVYMLLLPIVLILILGTALKGEYTPGDIKKANVYYYSKDTGKIPKQLESYLNSNEINNSINFKKVKSKEEGLISIKSNERSSFIYIDSDFTSNIQNQKKSNIYVYNQRSTIQTTIIKNILNSFINTANSMYISYSIGGDGNISNSYDSVIDSPIDIKGKNPRAIDYYAVTMLVMTLMYGALYGSYSICEIYEEKYGIRTQITPINKLQILLGNIFSSIITVFLEGLILVLTAKYAFKANYGTNMGLIIFIILSMAIFTNVIGMTISVLFKKSTITSSIINILVIGCTFISGGYNKFQFNTPIYDKIIKFVPNGMAHNAMFNLIYTHRMDLVNSNILSIWIGIILCIIISIIAGRRWTLE